MNDMHGHRSKDRNPQSDRSYNKTDTGVHKSKLGGANRQAGSSWDGGKSDANQSSDSPTQSGDTGADDSPSQGSDRPSGTGKQP
jgi:hypothetical protein